MSETVRVSAHDGSPAEWDSFVTRTPGWTHCHLAGWRSVMERAFGHECLYLAAREGDALTGVLPLVRVRSLLFGHYLVSMPFLNYGGPLGGEAAIAALCDAASALAARDRVKLLELRSRQALPVTLPVSHHKITVTLDLGGDEEALWKRLDSKLRSQVRRPQKEGLTAQFGPDQLPAFYEVFRRHMRDLGTPVLAREAFQSMLEAFPDSMRIGCIYHGNTPVAAGAGFRWGDELEITWASSLIAFKQVAPNMLLYWEFMRRALAEGIRRFNFGRCTPGSGTHKFKRQWGGEDEPLHWYRVAADSEVRTPSPTAGAYAWGTRLWRRLPLSVTSTLGPRIVRWIP